MTLNEQIANWAKQQKRVTNRTIRERFDVDADEAGIWYGYLKRESIIGHMGYVVKEGEK